MLTPKYDSRLAIKPSLSLAMLACLFLFFLIAMSLLMQFISLKMTDTVASLRIMAVVQDVFMFILPAIATAMISTRLPAWLLRIDKLPSATVSLTTLGVMIASVPLINILVEWNSNLTLPESMHTIAVQMKMMEEAAEASINAMLSGTGPGALVMGILIVGVFAGFSEEIFFRGAMQRFIGFTVNHHVAIWITAFIFSAIHLQFFGFFPRLVLGAFFGYLAYCSGSLWLAVYAHVFNNSMVVITKWFETNNLTSIDFDAIGVSSGSLADWLTATISVVIVIAGLSVIKKLTSDNKNTDFSPRH